MEAKFNVTQWGSISDKLQKRYPELTNADLMWGRTTGEDLIQMISSKLGKSQKDLLDIIDSFDYLPTT